MKNTQLRLVVGSPSWKLSKETKTIGRAGLAKAREALDSAQPADHLTHEAA